MRVEITKTMVKALNKALKSRKNNGTYTSINTFEYDNTLSARMYDAFVGDIFNAFDNHDYDYNTCTYKAIRVIYNDECYSLNRYITTADLSKCFKASDKTYNGFINTVFDTVEI